MRRWKTSDAAFRTEKEQKRAVSPAASLRRKRPSASLGGDGSKDRPGRSDGGFEHTLFHQLAAAPCAEHHAQAAPLCGRARQSGVQPHAAPEGCLDLPAAVCTRTAQLGDDGAVQPRAGRMPALTCSASLPGAGASRRAAQSAASIHSPEGSCAHSARARGAAAAAHKSSTARPNRKYRRRERVMGRPPFKNSGKERFTALFIAYSCFYLVNECTQNRGFEMNDRS